jgi:hypothetical protein
MNSLLLLVSLLLVLLQGKPHDFSNLTKLLESVDSQFEAEFQKIDFKSLSE